MERQRARELDGVPELCRGSHLAPSAGACFMEYASVLAGEPWSDHPRCTHPALAQLARLVNDAAPTPGRQLLTPLVPEVIGVTGSDAAITPTLVWLCIDTARRRGHDRWTWALHQRWALRRVRAARAGGSAGLGCRCTDAAYREGPALHAMTHAVRAIGEGPAATDGLVQLLSDAIVITRRSLDRLGHRSEEPSSRRSAATVVRESSGAGQPEVCSSG